MEANMDITTIQEFFGINEEQLLETPNDVLERMYECNEMFDLHLLGYAIPIFRKNLNKRLNIKRKGVSM